MKLVNNKGFKWYKSECVYVKGYFFYNGVYFERGAALTFFERVSSYLEFKSIITKLNGCFSVIIEKKGETFAAVDRLGSFPLFYDRNGSEISDSAIEIRKDLKLTINDIDRVSVAEMIASGFVHGDGTIYSRIAQVLPGQTISTSQNNNRICAEFYFKHIQHKGDTSKPHYETLLYDFEKISENIFDRLISSLQGRTVILPLSGGYDSRFIACMLKKKGYENVICYTYGQAGSYEVTTSKKVAKSLGYEWHYIEYKEHVWSQILNDSETLEYAYNSNNFSTIPHFQDYPALKFLSDENILPEDGVIVTGFCGDLPAGSFVLTEEDENDIHYDLDWLVRFIYSRNYKFKELPLEYRTQIIKRIETFLLDMGQNLQDFNSFTSLYESWFTLGRPVKWVINSNRVYEFSGLEWRMPLWDNEFVDFFYNLDVRYRRNSKLYQDFLLNNLFEKYDVSIQKPSTTNSRPLKYNKTFKSKLRRIVYNNLIKVAFKTGWSSWNYYDVNNYGKAAIILYQNLNNKWLFDYKDLNFHQMNALWWSEKISSDEIIKEIFNRK
jgi:asparagine synthase (glutamine-hydrolysing)